MQAHEHPVQVTKRLQGKVQMEERTVKCLNPWDCQSKRIYDVNGAYRTLDAGNAVGGQAHGIVYAIEGNTVDRASGKNGRGWCENVSPTLNTQDRHAVIYALEGNGARPSHAGNGYSDTGQMYTLNTIEQHSVCYSVDCRNLEVNREKSGTLQAKENGGFSYNYLNPVLMENKHEQKV